MIIELDKSKKVPWNTFGFSPFQWMRVDISSIYTTSALTFKLKSTELPKLQTILFSYEGKKEKVRKNIK